MNKIKGLWPWLRQEVGDADWNGFGMSLVGAGIGAFIGILLTTVILK